MSAAPGPLVDHYFRHEYGRLVASLVRRVGLRHLEEVEDAVQGALETALSSWLADGVPENPTAWLHRVAANRLVGGLRVDAGRRRILDGARETADHADEAPPSPRFADEIRDELLRMLFVCCDEDLPEESRLALALKTLCGFGASEIAARLFTTEANVYKRLERARGRLRERAADLDTPPLDELRARLPGVHAVLYSLFDEGYLSSHAEHAIRAELCEEAIRLASLLAAHPVGASPPTFALLALMHLHAARLATRQDADGGVRLLEEQDRAGWDVVHLQAGARWLARAADGEVVTRFHVEAAIAAEHAFAASFAATRWDEIAGHYATLERMDPSPLHRLNRAVAVAQAHGPRAGLAVLDGAPRPAWLDGHYLWSAVLADLHGRAGDVELATHHRAHALAAVPSPAVAAALARRLRPSGGSCR